MKRVVVTGAKGGTGRSIVRELHNADYDVLGIDLTSCGMWESGYRQVDLLDGAAVYDALVGAEAVVHFGSLPTDSWTSWEVAYRNLALGGYHVLQASANLGVKRVVLASSPEVYGPSDQLTYLPVDEKTAMRPPGIYGAAKQNLEALAANYVRWQQMSIAALRPQRIVYEGSYEWRFRKFTLNNAAAADALWSYVDARDVATACRLWIESDRQGFEAFNVAAEDVCVAVETQQLVREFYAQISDVRVEIAGRQSLIDCSKIKQMLGWKPQYQWEAMAIESETQGFPKDPPARPGVEK